MRLISLMLCLSFLVACGGGGAAEPEGASSAGGDTSMYEGPVASTDVARGEEVFITFCEDCHGEDSDGPKLSEDPHSPARMRQQVREGSGKMRPFPAKRLSDEDLENLLAYLSSVGAVN